MAEGTTSKTDRISEKRYHDYYAALGEFVTTFAHVETVMFYVLVHYSRVSLETAKAVFSGTRMDATAGFLRRMIEQNRIPKKQRAYLEKALVQLALISSVRNLILHYGVEHVATSQARATNELRAISRSKSRSVPATRKDLLDMNDDLMDISHGLYLFNTGPRSYRKRSDWAEELRKLWRYKLPPPTQRRPPRRGKSAKQPHPPRSSRA